MKRTKAIHLDAFRKHETNLPLTLAVSAMFVLSGCDKKNDKEATTYNSVEACQRAEPEKSQQCSQAWLQAQQQAIRTAPVYSSEAACTAEYGEGQCQPKPDPHNAQGYSSHSFIPLMAGFMMGRMLSSSRSATPLFTPRSANRQGQPHFVDANGRQYGAVASSSAVGRSNASVASAAHNKPLSAWPDANRQGSPSVDKPRLETGTPTTGRNRHSSSLTSPSQSQQTIKRGGFGQSFETSSKHSTTTSPRSWGG